MSKWLSIELGLLLLVSMIAFAGFVGFSAEDSDDFNELSGFATACGGTSYGACPQNNQCRQVSKRCVSSSWGRCRRYAPVYGCVYVPPPKPTSSPKCIDTDGGKDYFTKGKVTLPSGQVIEDTCGLQRYEGYVIEYHCEREPYVENYKCSNGCKDGACLPSSTTIIKEVKFSNSVYTPSDKPAEDYLTISITNAGSKIINLLEHGFGLDANGQGAYSLSPPSASLSKTIIAPGETSNIKLFGTSTAPLFAKTHCDGKDFGVALLTKSNVVDSVLFSTFSRMKLTCQSTTTAPKLSDFVDALLAGKQVQMRIDNIKGTGIFSNAPTTGVGLVFTFSYNLAKSEITLSGTNPSTGKFETQSQKVSKEEIINTFNKFVFDSKTRTFRDDGSVPGVALSGVYALDGSLKSIAPKLSDFVEALFVGKQVQLRVDSLKGSLNDGPIPNSNAIGLVYTYYYNPAKNELTLSGINPSTGKFETVSKVINTEEIQMIKSSFSKLIFDSAKRTFRDDGSVPGVAVSGVYALDGSLKAAQTPAPTSLKYSGVSITCYDGETTKINVNPCKTPEELNRLREYIKADFCKGRCDSTGKKCGAGDSGILDVCQ